MLSTITMAYYMAKICRDKQISYNATKIQKLLYLLYGTWLVIKDGEQLMDEMPIALPHGPVFASSLEVWNKKSIEDFNFNEINNEVKSVAEKVIASFASQSASKLSAWSHLPNSPWDKVSKEKKGEWGNALSNTDIMEYFAAEVIERKC